MITETQRLILKEMSFNDYDDLYEILADSDIMKHYPYTFDEKRVKRWISLNIERYSVYGFGLWKTELKENGEMIGNCGITMQNINGTIKPELGYHIKKKYQRLGYAKEASFASLKWIFDNTPFKKIYSYMPKDNLASFRTALSVGMKKDFEYVNPEGTRIMVCSIDKNDMNCKQSEDFHK